MFNSLSNCEQILIRQLRCGDNVTDLCETYDRPNRQLDGCLTHLEILLLLMASQLIKRMEHQQPTKAIKIRKKQMTKNSDDENDNDSDNDGDDGQSKIVDTKFTFEQIYNEYSKYILKQHKYFYDKAVVSKTFYRLIDRGFLKKHSNRYVTAASDSNGRFNDEQILSLLLNTDELKLFVESKAFPTEIKRYSKMNTV